MIQRIGRILIVILTVGLVLSPFEAVRNFGISLFASAGAAGLVLGFAARPVLENLIAWDLRCYMREKMLTWLQQTHPEAPPRIGAEIQPDRADPASVAEPLQAVRRG